MFAVYAKKANFNNPLASVVVGERPEPVVPDGWVRVRVTHASLNRHDIFTLCGVTAQEQPIPFPMILGNDGAGQLDDGTPVVIYPLIGSDSWRGDETLDPAWHVFSELVPGTMADYVAVPKRSAPSHDSGPAKLCWYKAPVEAWRRHSSKWGTRRDSKCGRRRGAKRAE